jgi:hypothetical protein
MSRYNGESNPNCEEYDMVDMDGEPMEDGLTVAEPWDSFDEDSEEASHCHQCGTECGCPLCDDCYEALEETPELDMEELDAA